MLVVLACFILTVLSTCSYSQDGTRPTADKVAIGSVRVGSIASELSNGDTVTQAIDLAKVRGREKGEGKNEEGKEGKEGKLERRRREGKRNGVRQ